MSYILDTLKKLEKEKSGFDHKFDLKKLMLKDNSETDTIKILKKRSRFLTFAILAIGVFFLLNFSVLKFSPPNSNPPPILKALREKKVLKRAQVNPIKNSMRSLSIPAEISEEVKASRDLKPLLDNKKDNVLNAINSPKAQGKKIALVLKETEIKREINEDAETLFVPQDLSDEEQNPRIDHLDQLIQKESIPTEINKLIDENREIKTAPAKAIQSNALPQDIVDLRISGIVFFGEGIPLNYAIASYKGETQMKLKEGDLLDDIEVLEIQSEKIILLFKNKSFEKKLGR